MDCVESSAAANEGAAKDPVQVLAALTRNNATFTERELDRYLQKHFGAGPDGTPDAVQVRDIADTKRAVLGHKEVLAPHDRDTGEAAGRFTTGTVREQERAALADGAAVVGAGHHRGVKARHQRVTFGHAVSAGGLKLVEGRASTGKSHSLPSRWPTLSL